MKTLIWSGAMALIVGLAATMSGQTEASNGSSSSSGYVQTSKLVGRKVKSFHGEEIGVIKDVVLDRSTGCMAYTVLSTGGGATGVASGGGKIVAVPWAVYSPTSDQSVLTVKVDREKIYNAPVFDYSRMDEYARPDYINNAYSYFGVSPGAQTAGTASGGAAAGTDVTGTAGATATPGEVATPTTIGTASRSKRASAGARATSAASPYGGASTNSSRKPTRSATANGTQPPIGRDETASPTLTEESPSESATHRGESKESRSKTTEETYTGRPSPTPELPQGPD